MVDWETTQFPDEKLPRSTAEYQGFRRICVPDEKHEGKFGINVFGSEGDWQGEDYRLIILYEYWADPGFKGYESLTEAQKACIEVVDRYKKRTAQADNYGTGQESGAERQRRWSKTSKCKTPYQKEELEVFR